MSRPAVHFAADRDEVQQKIAEMVALQVRKVSGTLDQIAALLARNEAAATGEHLRTAADIARYEARIELIEEVRALLPDLSLERRADRGAEVISDARHASDVPRRRGRPGHVDPGGSETGGGYRTP
jgi:hypothetical protein